LGGVVLAVAVMLRPWRAALATGAIAYAVFVVVGLVSACRRRSSTSPNSVSRSLGRRVHLRARAAAFGGGWNRSSFAFASVVRSECSRWRPRRGESADGVDAAAGAKTHKASSGVVHTKVTFGSGLSDTGNSDEQAELQPECRSRPRIRRS